MATMTRAKYILRTAKFGSEKPVFADAVIACASPHLGGLRIGIDTDGPRYWLDLTEHEINEIEKSIERYRIHQRAAYIVARAPAGADGLDRGDVKMRREFRIAQKRGKWCLQIRFTGAAEELSAAGFLPGWGVVQYYKSKSEAESALDMATTDFNKPISRVA